MKLLQLNIKAILHPNVNRLLDKELHHILQVKTM
jgi:hypothetical protein